ncbi:hypothetical protein NEUTE1DRAFT_107080 [Neurospora tetrasperma FGSC 2508]|uniref:Uncharacterized protein n=1 Tax=Neurospora tetrasperma (strain FGSC 2508 / ATCC MYA-4615 / P0657) TaxID=510951 RepID=F8MCF3_NEUT8|nr:uncharacterized protein NEUTE1DRAFT_107080 [Neurospora tetrasperma FGSC 2508]EGO60454.1 hypothetical protein NEUTE1DRAFT_107080 [Neurospora tetrasperma FGSC 2508]EGZ75572.1 hypothetical protein NEUTE2DRAFT_136687 [Neurospora tetrasperma FGSC 2509]
MPFSKTTTGSCHHRPSLGTYVVYTVSTDRPVLWRGGRYLGSKDGEASDQKLLKPPMRARDFLLSFVHCKQPPGIRPSSIYDSLQFSFIWVTLQIPSNSTFLIAHRLVIGTKRRNPVGSLATQHQAVVVAHQDIVQVLGFKCHPYHVPSASYNCPSSSSSSSSTPRLSSVRRMYTSTLASGTNCSHEASTNRDRPNRLVNCPIVRTLKPATGNSTVSPSTVLRDYTVLARLARFGSSLPIVNKGLGCAPSIAPRPPICLAA